MIYETRYIGAESRSGFVLGVFFLTRSGAGWEVWDLTTGHRIIPATTWRDALDRVQRVRRDQEGGDRWV